MVDKESIRQGYDAVASAYAAQRSPDAREREILDRFCQALSDGDRVLDAGCGHGVPVLRRLSDAADAVGVDLSREQIRRAGRNVPRAAHAQADISRLPVADSAVDAVTAVHSLIHVPRGQHQQVVDEFARVLRPGGRLLLSEGPREWHGANPDWLDSGTEMAWHIAGAETTRDQLRSAGFTVTDEWRTGDELTDEASTWVFFVTEYDG